MKIAVTRDTVGRLVGVLVLAAVVLALSFMTVAWTRWEINPGLWSPLDRGVCAALVLGLLLLRWLAGVVVVTRGDE